MRVIGITGGIGSGKSAVSKLLRNRNIPVFDADSVARELLTGTPESNPLLDQAVKHFAPEHWILNPDLTLNRKALGRIVFGDARELAWLENLTHPTLIDRFNEWKGEQEQSWRELVAIEAAILIEKGWDRFVDQIFLVTARDDIRIMRVKARDNLSLEDIRARISNQWSDKERHNAAARPIFEISNNEGLAQLEECVELILQQSKDTTLPPTTPAKYRKAVYAGSFDPPTKGHIDLITRAAGMYDHVVVLVGYNPSKTPFLSPEERVQMMKRSLKPKLPNVEFVIHNGLLVDFCVERGINTILRGLRSVTDFEFEFALAQVNSQLVKQKVPCGFDLETVFVTCKPEFAAVSSSVVKEVYRFGGDVRQFVPDPVADYLQLKWQNSH